MELESQELPFGRYLEDFSIGDIYKHWPGKTITESDNNLFSLLTMNHHPLHIDKNFASNTNHKKILVVGTLTFSLAVGLTVRDISGKAIANLEYEKISHLAPVFIGDTIYVISKILDITYSRSKPDRGIVYVETSVINQDNVVVLNFRRKVLIPKQNKKTYDVQQ